MRKLRLGIYDLGLPGGSTTYLRDLIAGIPSDRYELVFFPPDSSWTQPATPSAAPKSVSPRKSRWGFLPESLRLAIGLLKETRALAREIRAANLDLFHTNYAGFETSAIAASMAGVKPVIATYNNLPSETYTTARWLQRFVEHKAARATDRAIAVSDATRRDWEQRCPPLAHRFQTIYYGIDVAEVERAAQPALTRRELGLPESGPLLVVVARLHPMKGIRYLLAALPAIRPDVTLVLIGDGPEREALEKTAPRNVKFLGWRKDAARVVALADIMVLPSINLETWGYALAEAMALGKPCVATNVGGMPELVAHDQTGLIIPPRDAGALAGAINRLLDNPALARQFGAAGRARVAQHFTKDKMQQATLAIYEEMKRP